MSYPNVSVHEKGVVFALLHGGVVATLAVLSSLPALYSGIPQTPLLRYTGILIIAAVIYVYIRTGVPDILQRECPSCGAELISARTRCYNCGEESAAEGFRTRMVWFLLGYPLVHMFWVVTILSLSGIFLSNPSVVSYSQTGVGPLSFFLLSPVTGGLLFFVMYPLTGVFWVLVFSIARVLARRGRS